MKNNMNNTNNTNNAQEQDTMAAIGIGAMIVFIALILVAAVAAAVIIQTAEKLQQNAQSTGEDTTDEMSGKIMVQNVFVEEPGDPRSAAAGGDDSGSYSLFFRLAAGSDDMADGDILYQISCDSPAGVNYLAGTFSDADVGDVVELGDSTETDVDTIEAGKSYRVVLPAALDRDDGAGGAADGDVDDAEDEDCTPETLFANSAKGTLYIHARGGGTTYDVLKVNEAVPGAVVV